MTALILHLASPLQRWGSSNAGGRERPTHPHPTRSGIIGLAAAALGRPRGSENADLARLQAVCRVDRPGYPLRDWHTVGGGRPQQETVLNAEGKPRGEGLIFETWYLSDAVFTVALTGPEATLDAVTEALARPVFPPYLGKRSCQPAEPLVLHRSSQSAEEALAEVPLHRTKPRRDEEVPVTYIYDEPPPGAPDAPPTRYLDDGLKGNTHVSRPVWEVQRSHPVSDCGGIGLDWLEALHGMGARS